eukprot:scaffold6694_cov33-Phaeocystis_antarctica.AAC.1
MGRTTWPGVEFGAGAGSGSGSRSGSGSGSGAVAEAAAAAGAGAGAGTGAAVGNKGHRHRQSAARVGRRHAGKAASGHAALRISEGELLRRRLGGVGGVGGVGDRARFGSISGVGGSDGLGVGARGEVNRAELSIAQYRVTVYLQREG